MVLKFDKSVDTYWEKRTNINRKQIDYDRQFQEIIMSKLSILSELWDFLKVRKKWWLAPILILLLLLGGLIILTQGSALAPYIYAIF